MNAVPAGSTYVPSSRLPELDGVRGLAALAIMLWHYVPSIAAAEPGTFYAYLARALSLCWSGVDLFFVLSGFLIGTILLRETTAENYFTVFYLRRAARIMPLYTLLLIGLAIGAAWSSAPAVLKPMFTLTLPGWSYPLFIQNFFMPGIDDFGPRWASVTWSLAVEEQFYLLLPLLIFIAPRRALGWLVAALALAAPMLRMITPGGMATYVLLPCRLDSLMAGVLLAIVWNTASGRLRLQKLWPFFAVAWAGLAIYAVTVLRRGEGMWELRLVHGWLVNAWLSLWFVLMLALLLAGPRSLGALFRWAPLSGTGRIAFGLYLIHGPMLHFCHYALLGAQPELKDGRSALVTALAAGLSLLAAIATYRWIENPCLKLGHRFAYRHEKNYPRFV